MGRIGLTGVIVIAVLFIMLSVFLASQITVADSSVIIPGMPVDPTPVSLLHEIWSNVVEWVKEAMLW